jgi:hypothetical protein
MQTMVGVFDRQEQVDAVIAQLAELRIDSTSVTAAPAHPGADGTPGILLTVRDVPVDAQDMVSTIMEMKGMRESESLPPATETDQRPPRNTSAAPHPDGVALPRTAATLAEEALGGAAGALAGGLLGSLVAGPGGALAGLVIGGAAGAGGAHLANEPTTSSSGPEVAGAAGALAGAVLGAVTGPGGAVIGGLVGAGVGGAAGEAIEDALEQTTARPHILG